MTPLAPSIFTLNRLEQEPFVALLGPIFENTPGIAAAAWSQRPFASRAQLCEAMVGVMRSLPEAEQLALIRAHPDLGTRAKMAEASVQEQASAGLDQLSPDAFTKLNQLNQAYRDKFDFPFIIAVRHHTQVSILEAFEQRLQNDRAAEQVTALSQIAEIARLRLDALVSDYPRDLIGYGKTPPDPQWPNQARLALQFVINYEEGGENCVLHGDPASEAFLSEIIGAAPLLGVRNLQIESMYEYGSRAGFWRLHRLFTQRNLPVTVYGVAMALARNPAAVEAMQAADWEIASHGYRWIDYQYVAEAVEREHIQQAIALHTQATGSRPLGFYQGRVSPNTRRLAVEAGGFLYDADSYADDLPYWDCSYGKPHLVIPYTLDANDMRFASPQGFNSGDQFFAYLRDTFDMLYAEGETAPKMMSVGLHCRLVGRPGRAAALARFLDYVQTHDKVWVCRRIDIARHWHEHHPA